MKTKNILKLLLFYFVQSLNIWIFWILIVLFLLFARLNSRNSNKNSVICSFLYIPNFKVLPKNDLQFGLSESILMDFVETVVETNLSEYLLQTLHEFFMEINLTKKLLQKLSIWWKIYLWDFLEKPCTSEVWHWRTKYIWPQ